jgi:hypothetical protein
VAGRDQATDVDCHGPFVLLPQGPQVVLVHLRCPPIGTKTQNGGEGGHIPTTRFEDLVRAVTHLVASQDKKADHGVDATTPEAPLSNVLNMQKWRPSSGENRNGYFD